MMNISLSFSRSFSTRRASKKPAGWVERECDRVRVRFQGGREVGNERKRERGRRERGEGKEKERLAYH